MQANRLLRVVVVASIMMLIAGDVIFVAFPWLFLDRHGQSYVLNNTILDYATVVPGIAGVLSGIGLAVRTRSAVWLGATALVALLFFASFFIGVIFGGGRV